MPSSSNCVYFSIFKNISFGFTFIYHILYLTFFSFSSSFAFSSSYFFFFASIFFSLSFSNTSFDSNFHMEGYPIFRSCRDTLKSTMSSSLNWSQIYNIFLKSSFAFYRILSLNFTIEFNSSSSFESDWTSSD